MSALELPLYLDYQATTPLDSRVLAAMMPYLTEKFGNPHSTNHSFGWEAEAGIEIARGQIGALIGAESEEIIFTSGATESNNMALKGMAYGLGPDKNHLITAATEHSCVLESMRALERSGFSVTTLPVDGQGLIDLEELEHALTDKTALVSIMAVNNEIGVMQDLAAIGSLCKARGVLFHCDAAQAVGKIPLDMKALNIDLLSISSHKIYGPKGIGALYVRHGLADKMLSLFDGGGQEKGLRSGTLAPALCVGLGQACALASKEMDQNYAHISTLYDHLKERLFSALEGIRLNGSESKRFKGNLNICFSGTKGSLLIRELRDIALSTGSACSTTKAGPSHVLQALGLDKAQMENSIRLGIGRLTSKQEIDYAAEKIIQAVGKIREMF